MNTSRKPLETGPGRMSALARLPVFLALEGKHAVLAGGSAAAAWKAELLAAAGAQVDIYAIEASDELLQIAAEPPRGSVTINRRTWAADDLKGAARCARFCPPRSQKDAGRQDRLWSLLQTGRHQRAYGEPCQTGQARRSAQGR